MKYDSYKKFENGTGIENDEKMKIDVDPMFSGVFGSGVNRRELLQMGAALGGSAALGGLSASNAYAASNKNWNPTVKTCYIPITDAAALLVAHEYGFYKDEGLESERPTLIRGWSPLAEAFTAHRFNVTHMLLPMPIWMRYNNNVPIKVTAWDHTNGSAIVVGKDSGINTPKDFGGKQVAVPYWYSVHNIVTQMILKEAGIKPVVRPQNAALAPDECNFLVLNPPDMPPALAAKSIDAFCVAEPFNALGELKAGGKVLRFTGDVWKGHPCCVVVMHDEDAVDPERAAWSQAVHNAIVRAQVYCAENREEVAERLSKDGKKYYPFPKEVVKRAMMFYDPAYYKNPHAIQHPEWGMDRINFQGWPYRSATEKVVTELKDTRVEGDTSFLDKLTPQFVADDLVNYDFIKKALDKNPGWRNDPSVPKEGDPFNRIEVFEV